MSAALIVKKAPAYATIQDTGRRGFASSGVPRSGAMDMRALLVLNALLGNHPTAACIEWALTGGELELMANTFVSVGGARCTARINGSAMDQYRAYAAKSGDVLSIESIEAGRFCYVAFAGGVDVPVVMGSRSTYLPGAFGGHEGRRLKTGDALELGRVHSGKRHQVSDPIPVNLRPLFEQDEVRYIPRDAGDGITMPDALVVSIASDRTGFRLDGTRAKGGGSITSEPVCPGLIQVPPGGEPIVLMADAPTIGGYRIAGCLVTADLGVLAQRTPGEQVRMTATTVEKAQRILDDVLEKLERIREWSLSNSMRDV